MLLRGVPDEEQGPGQELGEHQNPRWRDADDRLRGRSTRRLRGFPPTPTSHAARAPPAVLMERTHDIARTPNMSKPDAPTDPGSLRGSRIPRIAANPSANEVATAPPPRYRGPRPTIASWRRTGHPNPALSAPAPDIARSRRSRRCARRDSRGRVPRRRTGPTTSRASPPRDRSENAMPRLPRMDRIRVSIAARASKQR